MCSTLGVQNCLVPDFVHNNRNNIDIKFSSNGFNPYITVADDVSSLGFLTLLLLFSSWNKSPFLHFSPFITSCGHGTPRLP